jgi:hypothetical protein
MKPAPRSAVASRRRRRHELASLLPTEVERQRRGASAKKLAGSRQKSCRVGSSWRAAGAHAEVSDVPGGVCGFLHRVHDVVLVRARADALAHHALPRHAGLVRRPARGKLPLLRSPLDSRQNALDSLGTDERFSLAPSDGERAGVRGLLRSGVTRPADRTLACPQEGNIMAPDSNQTRKWFSLAPSDGERAGVRGFRGLRVSSDAARSVQQTIN